MKPNAKIYNSPEALLNLGKDIGWNEAIDEIHKRIAHLEKAEKHAEAETIRQLLYGMGHK